MKQYPFMPDDKEGIAILDSAEISEMKALFIDNP